MHRSETRIASTLACDSIEKEGEGSADAMQTVYLKCISKNVEISQQLAAKTLR